MLTAFDHLVVAVRDLAGASETWRRLGFDARPGGRNPGRGTHNAIIRFGVQYIELLSIEDHALARDRAPSGQELWSYLHGRDGGAAAWVAQSDDVVADAERAAARGFDDIGAPVTMRRARPDGTEFAWRLLIPGGAAFRRTWPLLIQWDTSEAERLRAEPPGDHANGVTGVRELSVVVPTLDEARTTYEHHLGVALDAPASVASLGAQVLRAHLPDLELALLVPTGRGPVEDELASHGPGPYELGLVVSDLDATEAFLRGQGVRVLDDRRTGLLVDPREARGVRVRFEAIPGHPR